MMMGSHWTATTTFTISRLNQSKRRQRERNQRHGLASHLMTAADYKSERQKRGTLKEVAALLGIHWTTLARRESGVIELTTEMALAMSSPPLRKTKRV